jgi:uncharacterized protein (TIGR03545 family)
MNKDKIKPVKIPGALKKPIKKEALEKKYVKYIAHEQDKQFLRSCFELRSVQTKKGDIEKFFIRDGLSKEDVKKIKSLMKVIKGNRKGAVNFIPLAFASIIVAAITIFFMIFANPLLGRAMEAGLESIFEARANVDNFRLSLIRFEISMTGITVANRDSPMTNLFQMSRTIIKLKPQAVLRGKIYIEEIRADQIRFGTARSVSGALPARPAKEKPPRPPKAETPPLIDLANFDAMALLNQEFDKLNTPKLYDDAINAYNEAAEKWPAEVESASARVSELRTNAAPILNINVASINNAETIRSTIQDINNMVTSVQGATSDVNRIITGLESDINTARTLETNARNSITDDINHLRSFIDLGSGAAFDVIEPIIRDILSDSAEQYIEYGLLALEILERVKAMSDSRPSDEKPKKEPRVAFRGRNVSFPAASYPAFYLGVLASDFTVPGDSWNWSFAVRDVSSNPDWVGRPVNLRLGLEEGGTVNRQVNFNGSADFRSNPQERFNAELTGSNFSVSLGDQLGNIGINGFSGDTDFSVNMSGNVDGRVSAGGNILIRQAQLIEPQGTLAEAVGIAVREAGNVNLGISYTDNNFNIDTNIAQLIGQALARTAEIYARRAMEDIERALRQRINEYIDGRFESRDKVDSLLRTARGDRAVVDQMQNALNAKRGEFEQRLRTAATDAAGQAVQNMLPGNVPSLPGNLPRLR